MEPSPGAAEFAQGRSGINDCPLLSPRVYAELLASTLQAKTELCAMIHESPAPALAMDGTWTYIPDVPTDRTAFIMKFVPEIYMRPEVHQDTKENFRLIRKLLEHSYFEYKFYDMAALKTMITMEMALKVRYEEINNKKWSKNKSLEKLIQWFEDGNYFEVYNPEYLKSLRDIRNLMAHPYEHTYSGPHSSHLIENVIDLVNGLYEDPELRKQRMDATNRITSLLEGFTEGIKVYGKDYTHTAHRAWPGFLNNKGGKELLHFYYKPIFRVPKEYFVNNQWGVSPSVHIEATSYKVYHDQLHLRNDKGEEIIIAPVLLQHELEDFKKWREEYEKFTQPTGDYLFTHTKIIDTFLMHLREFHKI